MKILKITGIMAFLVLCSIQDIREKRLSIKLLAVSGLLFSGMSLLFEEIPIEERLYNILPGMIAFVIALLTKEQIGYGDAACLAVLGILVSAGILFGAVMAGLVLLSFCSIILLVRKKADRKTTLPFVPFLSAGILWQIMLHNV